MRNKILFIINPISGQGRQLSFPDKAIKYLDNKIFKYEFVFTEKAKEAIEISRNASENFDIIIAVGGDGTVNEVSQGLVGKSSLMGIIPVGSGNGLARHLKIPLAIPSAIKVLNKQKVISIDRIQINDQTFVNIAGIGFDAHVGNKFAEFGERGIMPYFYLALKEYSKYKPGHYKLFIDGKEYIRDAFSISFANSTQFGNNAHIAPNAKINDGLIDVSIVKSFPHTELPNIGIRLFNKSIDRSKYVEIIKARHIIVCSYQKILAHIDGEPLSISGDIELKILPESLKVVYK